MLLNIIYILLHPVGMNLGPLIPLTKNRKIGVLTHRYWKLKSSPWARLKRFWISQIMNSMSEPSRLSRRLKTTDAVMIGLGSMIGAGIFVAAGPASSAAGSGRTHPF